MIRVGVRVRAFSASGSGGGFDADAQAFFDRVTTAGGTLTTTEKNATNQLVLDLKSAGTWTPMKAIYPMVGASAAACAQNLKSSSFTGTFTSGWTFASTGVTPNGTSAYMNTGLNISSNLSLSSAHFSFYSRTNLMALVAFGTDMGDLGAYSATSTSNLRLRDNTLSGSKYFAIGSDNGVTIAGTTSALGLNIGNQFPSNTRKYFQNGSLLATSTLTITGTLPNNNVTLGMGQSNTYGTNQCAFASIGDGLTDTQASNFYTAVQAFQTTLSRQV